MNAPYAEMQFITLNLITQRKWCPASLYLSTFRVEIAHTVIELVSVPTLPQPSTTHISSRWTWTRQRHRRWWPSLKLVKSFSHISQLTNMSLETWTHMLHPCRGVKQQWFESIPQTALLIVLQTLSLDAYHKDHLPVYSIIIKRLLLGYGQTHTLCQCLFC